MGKFCFIVGCVSNSKDYSDDAEKTRKTLFKFPKDPVSAAVWRKNVENHQNCDSISSHSKVCIDHFEEKFIVYSDQAFQLTKDAYPTIFRTKLNRNLTDTSEKCRFCLKSTDEVNKIEITKTVQKQFVSLTQTELRNSQIYSNFICKNCQQSLNFSCNFRRKLIENQSKLHEALESFEDENSEPEEIIDVKAEVMNDEFGPEIKQESFEFEDHEIEYQENKNPSDSKEDLEFKELGDAASFDFPIFEVPVATKKVRRKKIEETEVKIPKKPNEAAMLRKKESVLCAECGGVYKRKSLRKHIDRAHMNIRKYTCDICNHKSYHKYQMRNHISIHSKEKNYICQECGKLFSNPALLSSHRNSMHLKSDERNHKCRDCSKQFKHKKDLKIHIRFSHLKEKRYFCEFPECGKTFNSRLHFNDHQASHSGSPTFSCQDCQKLFYSEFKLKNHMALHVRAFSCNLCEKRFPKEYKLNAHLLVHSGQRNFACTYCDNKYFSKSHLNRHVLNYHINLKLKCEIPGCATTSLFSKKESYKSHLLANHRNIEENTLKEILAKIRDIRPAMESEFLKMKPKQE